MNSGANQDKQYQIKQLKAAPGNDFSLYRATGCSEEKATAVSARPCKSITQRSQRMRRPRHIIQGPLRTLALVLTLTLGTTTAQAMSEAEAIEIAKQTTPTTLQRLIDAVAQYNAEEDN